MRIELPLPVSTPRTVLRRLAADDLDAFMSYRSDPDVGRYQGWTPMDREASLAFLESMSHTSALVGGEWWQLAIADAGSNVLLGDIGVHPGEDFGEIELGFTLAARHQGRGLAAEAVGALVALLFRQTPAQSVHGVTDARNVASIALLERLGFQRARAAAALFRGEPCTEYHYVRSRGTPR